MGTFSTITPTSLWLCLHCILGTVKAATEKQAPCTQSLGAKPGKEAVEHFQRYPTVVLSRFLARRYSSPLRIRLIIIFGVRNEFFPHGQIGIDLWGFYLPLEQEHSPPLGIS